MRVIIEIWLDKSFSFENFKIRNILRENIENKHLGDVDISEIGDNTIYLELETLLKKEEINQALIQLLNSYGLKKNSIRFIF